MVRKPGSPSVWRMGPIRAQPGADAIISVPGQAMGVTMTAGAFRGPIVLPSSFTIERKILSGEWSETDTVAEAWLPPTGLEDEDENFQRNYIHIPTALLPELSPSLNWRVLPDGRVAFSDSTTWTVKIAEAGAGVVRIIKRPFRPEPLTDRMIRADKDRRLRRIEESAPSADRLERARRTIENKDYYSATCRRPRRQRDGPLPVGRAPMSPRWPGAGRTRWTWPTEPVQRIQPFVETHRAAGAAWGEKQSPLRELLRGARERFRGQIARFRAE